jgi:holliday junction DNA helicase RuvA
VIAHLDGSVSAVAPDGAVIDVGGVGLLVQCTPGTLARFRLGERTRVATSLVVREDALTLYGFASDDERGTFELLQTASGVGPRLAQAALSVLPPAEVRVAIATADVATLTRVPGIGKKGAERLVLELRDKIGAIEAPGPSDTTATAPWRDQVGQALVGLGWTPKEADEAVTAVAPDAAGSTDVPALLRAALRVLSPR